jgi:hypothetical protein
MRNSRGCRCALGVFLLLTGCGKEPEVIQLQDLGVRIVRWSVNDMPHAEAGLTIAPKAPLVVRGRLEAPKEWSFTHAVTMFSLNEAAAHNPKLPDYQYAPGQIPMVGPEKRTFLVIQCWKYPLKAHQPPKIYLLNNVVDRDKRGLEFGGAAFGPSSPGEYLLRLEAEFDPVDKEELTAPLMPRANGYLTAPIAEMRLTVQ